MSVMYLLEVFEEAIDDYHGDPVERSGIDLDASIAKLNQARNAILAEFARREAVAKQMAEALEAVTKGAKEDSPEMWERVDKALAAYKEIASA